MRKIVLTFGLIAGAVMSGMLVLTLPFQDQLDSSTGVIIGYTSMVLASLTIYFGVRQYRDNVCDGRIQFGQAFKAGLAISAVAVACYVVTWEVVFNAFLPDFGEKYLAETLERARAAGATAAELAEKAAEGEKFWAMYKSNPLVRIGFTILEPLPVVLLFSLGTAGLLKRKQQA